MESDDESVSSENSVGNQIDENEITTDERDNIRKEISTMSFEDLHKLKEKIGSNVFNETVFGVKARQPKTNFKRANKNRPRETSSKRKINVKPQLMPRKIQTQRDPRFDPLCGAYDDKSFKSNYKFLKDVRKKERTELEKQYKSTEDPQSKNKIKFLMQRIDNQIREQERKEKHDTQIREEKKEIKEKLKQGEKPVYKKKSEKKIENLIQQYEELKKSNKLKKHIEKRSKKLATKDRKKMENQEYNNFV